MHRKKTGMTENLKDFSHTWLSTAQGKEDLSTILSLVGETVFTGLMFVVQQEGNHTVAASSPLIIQRLIAPVWK